MEESKLWNGVRCPDQCGSFKIPLQASSVLGRCGTYFRQKRCADLIEGGCHRNGSQPEHYAASTCVYLCFVKYPVSTDHSFPCVGCAGIGEAHNTRAVRARFAYASTWNKSFRCRSLIPSSTDPQALSSSSSQWRLYFASTMRVVDPQLSQISGTK